MSDHETKRSLLIAAAVLGMGALASLAGVLTPPRPRDPAHDPQAHQSAATSAIPLDPQPEVVLTHVAFSISGSPSTPQVAALLNRLGGADPSIRGLAPADPALDDQSIQRAIAATPGTETHAVLGVIQMGGQQAGIIVETNQTDPLTGLVTGRKQIMVLATPTVLEGGGIALQASLRDEADSTALAVLGRRMGVPLGRSGEVDDALILQPGQPAAIRLPGPELQVVFITFRVRSAQATESAHAAPSGPAQPEQAPLHAGE